jgi:uncharacterized Tic20 family protein
MLFAFSLQLSAFINFILLGRFNTLSVISFLPFIIWQLAKKDATPIVNASYPANYFSKFSIITFIILFPVIPKSTK